jgi:hypothetical protein
LNINTPISLYRTNPLNFLFVSQKAYNATVLNLQLEKKMAYWGRVQQSKLKHLAFQWKRYYSQNPLASSRISAASQARKTCLSQNSSWVFQNSDRASGFCSNMRLFGAPAQVNFLGHSLLILLVLFGFIYFVCVIPVFAFASISRLKISLKVFYGYVGNRHFSVFNEFSEKMKGEANRYFS